MGKKWVKEYKPTPYIQKEIPTLEDWSPKSDTIHITIYLYENGGRRVCVYAHVDGVGLTADFEPKDKQKAQELYDTINELSTIDEMVAMGMRLE